MGSSRLLPLTSDVGLLLSATVTAARTKCVGHSCLGYKTLMKEIKDTLSN